MGRIYILFSLKTNIVKNVKIHDTLLNLLISSWNFILKNANKIYFILNITSTDSDV